LRYLHATDDIGLMLDNPKLYNLCVAYSGFECSPVH